MITASDTEHMRLRRLANPAFLMSGVLEVEPVLQYYSELLCSQLAISAKDGSAGGQNMVSWFLWTLNDVIGQLALDQEFQCLEKRRLHPWPSYLLAILKQTALFNQFRRFGVSLKFLAPFLPAKVREEREQFLGLASGAIATRLAREEDADANNGIDEKRGMKKRPDIVGLMLREMKNNERLTEPEVTSNSVLIVGGGAETTSTCLSATLYHLCKTPRVMRKLCHEIRSTFATSADITIRATANLPYLKATIDESLRIFPVASYITPRVTVGGGHVIDGEMVPGGVSAFFWFGCGR